MDGQNRQSANFCCLFFSTYIAMFKLLFERKKFINHEDRPTESTLLRAEKFFSKASRMWRTWTSMMSTYTGLMDAGWVRSSTAVHRRTLASSLTLPTFQVADDFSLQSSCSDYLVQPPIHRSTVGSRTFSTAGPKCLPPEVTSAPSLTTFHTAVVMLGHNNFLCTSMYETYRIFPWRGKYL